MLKVFDAPEQALAAADTYKLEFLEYCRKQSPAKFRAVLEEQLLNPVRGTRVSRCHEVLASLPWAAIVTTNLDNLLESSFVAMGNDIVVVDNETNIASAGLRNNTLILKMHGSVSSPDLVLTFSDYEDFDLHRPAMKAMVIALFARFPVLILGAGLSDPNVKNLYGIVYSVLGEAKHDCFYVSEPMPDFLEKVWVDRRFQFIHIRNEDLEGWLDELQANVEKLREKEQSRKEVEFLKRNALLRMSEMISRYDRLQQEYLATVHIPDLTMFQNRWETTLYAPLRSKFINHLPNGIARELLYIGPGPNAPLFRGPTSSFAGDTVARRVKKLVLADVCPSVLQDAKQELASRFPDLETQELTIDISGGRGEALLQYLCDSLNSSNSTEELEERLNRDATRLESESAVASGTYLKQACIEQGVTQQFDVVYSEMVASFTGTAPVMAFETATKRKFSGQLRAEKGAEILERLTTKILNIWQRYNDAVFRLHILSLSHVLKEDGVMIIATDVEKKFAAPGKGSIFSFTSTDLPDVDTTVARLDMRYMHESATWWVDQPFDFPITIEGVRAEYFLAHKHRISLVVYKKMRSLSGADAARREV